MNMKMVGSFSCRGKEVKVFQDCFNSRKKWLVKRTSCRHYYFAQVIRTEQMFGEIAGANTGRMVRTTKKHFEEIGIVFA